MYGPLDRNCILRDEEMIRKYSNLRSPARWILDYYNTEKSSQISSNVRDAYYKIIEDMNRVLPVDSQVYEYVESSVRLPVPSEASHADPVPIKQKLIVPVNKQDEQTEIEELQCVSCLDNKKCCLIQPCNHLCLCISCSKTKISHCSMCRSNIETITLIYL